MKFNTKTNNRIKAETHSTVTENYEGGLAYTMSPKLELYQRVATWLVNEPKFYGSSIDEVPRIIDLVNNVANEDPEFILKLAYHCRTVLNLRTAPVFLLVEASLISECKPFVRQYTPKIIIRADQITEALSYLRLRIGDLGDKQAKGSVPHALKKGLADSFHNFNRYQFGKYNRKTEFKLRDALKLVRPKPITDNESSVFKSIIDGTLESPNTWEVAISTKGSTTENWQNISEEMPYMALIRNLRTLLEKKVKMDKINKRISDPELVRKSRQLPFRFVSAYNAIKDLPLSTSTITALDKALSYSADNLPRFDGVTVIAADHSGSMQDQLSLKSEVKRVQVADTFLSFAHKISDNPITMIYGERLKLIQFSQMESMLGVINKLEKQSLGGTYTYMVLEYLTNENIKADRIIIPTDEQGYGGSFYESLLNYRSKVNPNVYCYMINLAGYGTTEVPENDPKTMLISGFSERILEFIKLFESDKSAMVSQIESISID